MTLLEFYSEHKGELAVLADDRALFVLSFVGRQGTMSIKELSEHLGWSTGELERLWSIVASAGLGEAAPTLRLTEGGRGFLETLGLGGRPAFGNGDRKIPEACKP